jgi:Domain of unknown function (DUF4367)
MTDRPTARYDDAALVDALRSLADVIDWPTAAPLAPSGVAAGPDIASRVRVRLADTDRRRTGRPWWQGSWRPVRRSLVLALIALLALAVVAGAVGLGLPGLRFILGGAAPSPTPVSTVAPGATPTPTPTLPREPGRTLGLGELVGLDQVATLTGIPVRLPADPRLGTPDAVWVDALRKNQVAYVWASDAALPETIERGVGLVLMRFDGTTDEGFYEKLIGGGTHIETVEVDGHDGYWIEGDPHFFYYVRNGETIVDEDRRWVGDALVWSDGTTTFRIESALGRDETIKIAESIE